MEKKRQFQFSRTPVGTAEKCSFRNYKASPGDFNVAAGYALTLAMKEDLPKLVLPGNSYGHCVYIVLDAKNPADAIRTVTAMFPEPGFVYAQVDPDGTIWRCVVE